MLPALSGMLPDSLPGDAKCKFRSFVREYALTVRSGMPRTAGNMPALPSYAAAVSFGSSIVPLNFGSSGSRPKLSP
jgi:hypothetical protein